MSDAGTRVRQTQPRLAAQGWIRVDLEEVAIARLVQPRDGVCEVGRSGAPMAPVFGIGRFVHGGAPEPPPVHATGMRGAFLGTQPAQASSASGNGWAPCVSRPCSATTRRASSRENTPATHAAEYSPPHRRRLPPARRPRTSKLDHGILYRERLSRAQTGSAGSAPSVGDDQRTDQVSDQASGPMS